jgi:chemotaxis protein CheD
MARAGKSPPFAALRVSKIGPGEFHVTAAAGEAVSTVLGSCVAACIRDPVTGVGGMNHFMLPESSDGTWGRADAAMRFGNFAMERLINEIVGRGGLRARLEGKLFGGARLGHDGLGVGERNAAYAERYLREEGITVLATDLRGNAARRVLYSPACGRAFVQDLIPEHVRIAEVEATYASSLPKRLVAGSIDLFD